MILKRQEYDEDNRLVTTWTAGIAAAERSWSDDWQSDVLLVRFEKDSPAHELGPIVLDGRNQGVYLCNDDGKTIDLIRRLRPVVREGGDE